MTILYRRHVIHPGILRDSKTSVMTAGTAVIYVLVDCCQEDVRSKRRGVSVTNAAVIQCRYVINGFTRRTNAVMTR